MAERIVVTDQDAVRVAQRLAAGTNGLSLCWTWRGDNVKGYGRISYRGRLVLTHRLMWAVVHGVVEADQHVLHTCDNPPCCRPDHLFIGTPAINAADRSAKGRHAHGERHGFARLTEADVVAMRAAYAAGGTSFRRLAVQYGITHQSARAAVLGITWRSVA